MNVNTLKLVRRMVAGKVLSLEHNPPQMDYLDAFQSVGGNLWPASDLMIKYLIETRAAEGKRILELGSGCGYVGLACGVLGATRVTLSDRVITERRMEYDSEGMLVEYTGTPNEVLLELCKDNITRNVNQLNGSDMDVQELEWGDNNSSHISRLSQHYDLIIGSDVTYHEDLSESLFWTVSELLKRAKSNSSKLGISGNENTSFLASHQFRLDSATAKTLATAKHFGLHCSTLATSSATVAAPSYRNTTTAATVMVGPVALGDRCLTSAGNTTAAAVSAASLPAEQTEPAIASSSLALETAALPMVGGQIRRYANEPGVTGDFVLWRFTLAPRPCN